VVAVPIDAPVDAPAGADEDGDHVPDAVDNCPHVANPQQQDVGELATGGADGVGDACDPEPARTGNRIALFEGFDGPLTGWTTAGSATVTDGNVRLGSTAALTSTAMQPRHLVVQLGGRALAGNGAVGFVITTGPQLLGQGVTLTQTTAANPRLRLAYNGLNLDDELSLPIAGGAGFTAVLSASRTNLTGVLTVADGAPISVRRSQTQNLESGRITIAGNGGAAFELAYVVVIALADP
jgi:hypothetical protein